jgi:hypothetical protein
MRVVNKYNWTRSLLSKKCRISITFVFAFTGLFMQSVNAQDNNSSISDELKNIWGNSDNGIYSQSTPLDQLGTNSDISFQDDTYDTPIDGGLGFLLAAGAGYVAHGLNRKRKRRKNEEDEEADSAGK